MVGSMNKPLVECVPNFSEGRDRAKIEAIADAIRSVPDVSLLDVDPGYDTNRTVYTFVGAPEAVKRAALEAARAAHAAIDMRAHRGAHPRIGALDVCPFVPVSGISMDECVQLSKAFGKELAEEFGVPVFLYEKSASRPERQSLADIRAGEYEGLADKLADPAWQPDCGPARFDARWGATVTGAREFLIAYNINLNTKDKKLVHDIALSIREAGRSAKDAEGNTVRVPGRLRAVRAIGWYIDSYQCAQVSVNLLNFHETPLYSVFDTVKEEAEARGLYVTGSELIGLIPLEAIRSCGRYYRRRMGKSPALSDRELVDLAAQTLGLRSVQPFEPEKKIVEWAIGRAKPLVSMDLRSFVDTVSSDSPAPGGGSVAALAGALGAALGAMDANLTVGKKGYEAVSEALSALGVKAQELKRALLDIVDEDTEAFNAVMEAMRLPKSSDAEKLARSAALEAAGKNAARVPLRTAGLCLETMKLCKDAAKSGNVNSATDAATGCNMAHAGLLSAILNVRINVQTLSDEEFRAAMRRDCGALEGQAAAVKQEMDTTISGVFNG
jgi:glutamate formiminotransferase/formiminotetrahydrofolate cyclodeaminase